MTHPLSDHRQVATGTAVYALRHTPTGKLYVGATKNARERARQWYYALNGNGHPVPAAIKALQAQSDDFTFNIIASVPASDLATLEATVVRRIRDAKPELLLNAVSGYRFNGGIIRRRGGINKRGIAPIRWLRGFMGLSASTGHTVPPEHSWPPDMRELTPVGAAKGVPFAGYLLRAAIQAKSRNPSPAAIQSLYARWRAEQIPSPLWATFDPQSVFDATKVPTPSMATVTGALPHTSDDVMGALGVP